MPPIGRRERKAEWREIETDHETALRQPRDQRAINSAATAAGFVEAARRTRRIVPPWAKANGSTVSCSAIPSQCWSTLFHRSPMAQLRGHLARNRAGEKDNKRLAGVLGPRFDGEYLGA